jgi:hypothetical protein
MEVNQILGSSLAALAPHVDDSKQSSDGVLNIALKCHVLLKVQKDIFLS